VTGEQTLINAALEDTDASAVTDAVKEAVARQISAINPKIEVRKTDYFNHAHFPDLVVWCGGVKVTTIIVRYS
jgi:hypothetical protein